MIKKLITLLLIALVGNAEEVEMQTEDIINGFEKECTCGGYINVVEPESAFYEIIVNNPIDAEFEWNYDSTREMLESAGRYMSLWEAEIINTLLILENELSEEDFKILMEAHCSWEDYVKESLSFNQRMYYPDGIVGSGLTYPRVLQVKSNEVKERAIELMAIEYSLTGKVTFFYD